MRGGQSTVALRAEVRDKKGCELELQTSDGAIILHSSML